jgi:hypothetical protein
MLLIYDRNADAYQAPTQRYYRWEQEPGIVAHAPDWPDLPYDESDDDIAARMALEVTYGVRDDDTARHAVALAHLFE